MWPTGRHLPTPVIAYLAPFTLASKSSLNQIGSTSSWNLIGLNGHVACLNISVQSREFPFGINKVMLLYYLYAKTKMNLILQGNQQHQCYISLFKKNIQIIYFTSKVLIYLFSILRKIANVTEVPTMFRCPHCNHVQQLRNPFLPCLCRIMKLKRFYFEGKSFTSWLHAARGEKN